MLVLRSDGMDINPVRFHKHTAHISVKAINYVYIIPFFKNSRGYGSEIAITIRVCSESKAYSYKAYVEMLQIFIFFR